MAQAQRLKRRADEPRAEEFETPGGKKLRSTTLVSFERKVDCMNETNERHFRSIVEKLYAGQQARPPSEDPRQAAHDKACRLMRVWPIEGDDQDELDAAF